MREQLQQQIDSLGITASCILEPTVSNIVDKYCESSIFANYSDDETTSMKITERNTFYHITGTITTLGAKSIEDAINSDNIDMLVQVVVKPWKYVVNNINM